MIIKKTVLSMPSADLKSWMKISPLVLALTATMPVSAAVYEEDEDEDEWENEE